MPYKIAATLETVNSVNYAILTGKTDILPYENGKKLSDTRVGVKLTLALQNARLSPLTVKFDHDPLPKVTDEMVGEACSSGIFLYVQIPDCAVNLFSTDNGIGMSATAQNAQLVTLDKK